MKHEIVRMHEREEKINIAVAGCPTGGKFTISEISFKIYLKILNV